MSGNNRSQSSQSKLLSNPFPQSAAGYPGQIVSLPPSSELLQTNVLDFSRQEYDRADTNPPPLCTKDWFLAGKRIVPIDTQPSNLIGSSNNLIIQSRLITPGIKGGTNGAVIQSIFFSGFNSNLIVTLHLFNLVTNLLAPVRKISSVDVTESLEKGRFDYKGRPVLIDSNTELLISAYHPSPGSIAETYITLSGGFY